MLHQSFMSGPRPCVIRLRDVQILIERIAFIGHLLTLNTLLGEDLAPRRVTGHGRVLTLQVPSVPQVAGPLLRLVSAPARECPRFGGRYVREGAKPPDDVDCDGWGERLWPGFMVEDLSIELTVRDGPGPGLGPGQ